MSRLSHSLFALIFVFFLFSISCTRDSVYKKNFIDFLNNNIINASKVVYPSLDKKVENYLGSYSKQYIIIYNFVSKLNDQFDEATIFFNEIKALNHYDNPDKMLYEVDILLNELNKRHKQLNNALVDAERKKSLLNQDEDLKVVFDKAFDISVINNQKAMNSLFKSANLLLEQKKELFNYIQVNLNSLTIIDGWVIAKNPTEQKNIEKIFRKISKQEQLLDESYNFLDKIL